MIYPWNIQLYDYFIENNLLYDSQYGFRKMHSTELAALEFADKINIHLDQGKIPLAIFLDLSKAFDTIDHSILINNSQWVVKNLRMTLNERVRANEIALGFLQSRMSIILSCAWISFEAPNSDARGNLVCHLASVNKIGSGMPVSYPPLGVVYIPFLWESFNLKQSTVHLWSLRFCY